MAKKMEDTVLNQVNVLGTEFDNYTMAEFLQILSGRLAKQHGTFIVTANPEIVMYAKDHPEYARLVAEADFVTADGIGVVKGAAMLGTPIKERVTGFDLMEKLLGLAAEKNYPVYLIGAKPTVADQAATKVRQKLRNINIVGVHDGYFSLTDENVMANIVAVKPAMVFVAMGFPRQEEFIAQLRRHLPDALLMGVGGSFDVLAGNVKRAPQWVQNAHLEWLYRLAKEPTRLKRMVVLPQFLLAVRAARKKQANAR
ncbi:MAG: WecB/TagA/CpsF family glycosyltransferase [Schleiferilactobacillus perolens]|uniref:WecB/TagA/CpsF family glycosyltransferase n=1 Tax=Schleiferilactobacillus perolens TaxID=100468 RepID=UPI0039E7A97F